jgi:kynurenine formamidase
MKKPVLIDLSHTLHKDIPTWGGQCGFYHKNKTTYDDSSTDVQFCTYALEMEAGIGTHIDAPSHCFKDATSIDCLEIENLMAPCVVISVALKAHADYVVSCADILDFEKQFGLIPEGSFCLVYTGWSQFWDDPEKYRNNYHFPSVSEEAAQLLLSRNIVGLGIDTLSPDVPIRGYPVHNLILGAGKYIIENIANAAAMPQIGAFTLASPLKIKGGTESPIRLWGMIFQD